MASTFERKFFHTVCNFASVEKFLALLMDGSMHHRPDEPIIIRSILTEEIDYELELAVVLRGWENTFQQSRRASKSAGM